MSTRRMEKLVGSLGITALSKSQVSEMAKDLDAHVPEFRHHPLDAVPNTFVAAEVETDDGPVALSYGPAVVTDDEAQPELVAGLDRSRPGRCPAPCLGLPSARRDVRLADGQ